VFGAPRLEDHERRALGEDYKTVAARGGGILQSVRDVRARSESELVALMRARVRALLAHGSTTIEVKSGYGLDPATELKQLRAIRETATTERATLVPTFLGAHEVPPEFRDRRADYVRLVCEEMIPAVAREHLATACDVFCEPGVFDVAETRTILTAAQGHGLALKLHADELEGSGGAELAASPRRPFGGSPSPRSPMPAFGPSRRAIRSPFCCPPPWCSSASARKRRRGVWSRRARRWRSRPISTRGRRPPSACRW